MDLLPYVDFDVDQAIAYARRINPQLQVLTVSATWGDGFDAWLAWLDTELGAVKQTRIDSLESELARLRGAVNDHAPNIAPTTLARSLSSCA
jgi:hydrogenase nickel incorporation protein HypB